MTSATLATPVTEDDHTQEPANAAITFARRLGPLSHHIHELAYAARLTHSDNEAVEACRAEVVVVIAVSRQKRQPGALDDASVR